ncbi:hypothetical protein HZA56_09190 [Candidatus Poribacteria bacterium]|nr:hypothetical protein [Candidatus Poribacteria bacterium]
MCYTCGCGMTADDMGDNRNITDKTIADAAEAAEITPEEAMQNMLEALKKKLAKKK